MAESQPKLFVLGDSISIQYGSYIERALAGRIAYDRKGGTDEGDVNAADRNGGDSSCVLTYLREQLAGGFTSDWLLLNCGLHDIKRNPDTDAVQVPLAQYRANLEAALVLLLEANIRLVWIRTTPVHDPTHARHTQAFIRRNADVKAYNAVADELFTQADVPVIDLNTFTRECNEDLFCDHVHYNEAVRKLQGEFIAAQVLAMVDQSTSKGD